MDRPDFTEPERNTGRHRKQPVALRELIEEFSAPGDSTRRGVGEVLRLKRAWPTLMGDRIALVSFPYRLNKKVLSVAVSDPLWIAELPYMKKDMIGRLEAAGINVSDIRFTLSKRYAPPPVPVKEPTPLRPEQKTKIDRLAEAITETRLRDAYIAAFSAFLRRGL